MESQSYDLEYAFSPGLMACYHGASRTTVTSTLPGVKALPDQALEISLTLKILYQDRGDRLHVFISPIPVKSTMDDRERTLPHLKCTYAMIDRRGTILEATDTSILLIHPFPSEPVPLGHRWEREEYLQPADTAEPLQTATYYTLENECEIEGAPHLQIAFRTAAVSYPGYPGSPEKRTITYRREGLLFFDPALGILSRIDQTSTFYTEQREGFVETTYYTTTELGEILEDLSMLPMVPLSQ
ncbi:MAG: hypothetical protein RDV48_15175 [Candidatus Eremiobacteraeota bacterium]|nr:hypothetical protein [Candidatus Eremiobacteraeota bacterium]